MPTDVLTKDEYFMAIAMVTAKRSPDPELQVGTCVVDDTHRIRCVGYNSMPKGKDSVFPWTKDKENSLKNKKFFICHAEENAIIPYVGDLTGCSIYVTNLPCNQCAKIIVQSGIKEVIYKDSYKDEKDKYKSSRIILEECDVKVRQLISEKQPIVIDFTKKM